MVIITETAGNELAKNQKTTTTRTNKRTNERTNKKNVTLATMLFQFTGQQSLWPDARVQINDTPKARTPKSETPAITTTTTITTQ